MQRQFTLNWQVIRGRMKSKQSQARTKKIENKNQTGDTFSLLSTLEQRTDFGRLKRLVRTPSQSPPDITLPQKIVTDQQINGPTSWC